jgi:hypothetical protein
MEDFEYLMLRKKTDATTWICKKYFHPQTERCKVRVVTSQRMAYIYGRHNHIPNLKTNRHKDLLPQVVSIIRKD